MKTLFVFLTIFALQCWAQTQEFTLTSATEIAIQKNPDLKAQVQEFERDSYAAKRGYSPFLPKLGLESGYQSFENPSTGQRGTFNNAFMEYSVFNGGRDYYLLESKSLRRDASEIALQQKRQETEWEVERSFHWLLFVTESIKFHEEALERNKTQQKAAAARKLAGLVSDADILEFDVYGTLLDSELTSLRAELIEAQTAFKKSLGLSDNVTPILKGKLSHYHVKTELSELSLKVANNSKAILIAQKNWESSDALSKSSLGEFLPNVSIKATYGSRDIREGSNDKEMAVLAVARWELFSGMDSYWGYKEAVAEKGRSEYALESSRLSTKTDLEKTYSLLKALEQRVDLEGLNRERSKKYFTAMAAEYKRGVKNSPDMRGASEKLLESQLRDLKYRYDFIVQKIELQKIVGMNIKTVLGSTDGHTD